MEMRDGDLCLKVLAARLSAHLDMIAGQIYDIEKDLGMVLSGKSTSEAISITKTQRLDFARQSLEDCALLMHLISSPQTNELGSVHDVEKIAARLKLETTQGLMRSDDTKPDPASGEIDLF